MRNIFYRAMPILLVLIFLVGCSQSATKTYEAQEITKDLIPFQLQLPNSGDPIVVIETELGVIKFVLFEQLSPQGVDIFKGYANSNYYSNGSFDRIEPGTAIQMDYKSTFPDDIDEADKSYYPLENSASLKHIKGAVSLIYQVGEFVSPSLAFIVGGEVSQEEIDLMEYLGEESFSKELIEVYQKEGGMPSLDGRFTVIGQVYEGFEVLEAINQLPIQESMDNKSHHVPKEPLAIKSLSVEIYE